MEDSLQEDDWPLGDAMWLPIMAVAYFVSLTALRPLAGAAWLQRPLRWVALANNALTCAYSTWAFVSVATILWRNWRRQGFAITPLVCDPHRRMLADLDLQLYIFYLSKYWEWIDTWILVLRGKPVWPPGSSQYRLHVFHHATTATVGWLAWRQELTVAWVGMLTNTFVHMLMYAYYTVVTLYPSIETIGIYITSIQITQFILCLMAFAPEAVDAVGGGVACGATRRCSAWMFFAYTVYLGFFVKMFRDKARKRAAPPTGPKEPWARV